MRQIRCYVDAPLIIGGELELPEAASNHLLRVLRLASGAAVTLFNGDGLDYAGQLTRVGRHSAAAMIVSQLAVANESSLRITLAQGIARGEKMDLILQKATELGVTEIWPIDSERTEVRLDTERMRKRLMHWRGVIASACEQCGRARLPVVAGPRNLQQLTADLPPSTLRLTLDPRGQHSLATLTAPASAELAFAIGPEGGFSSSERDQLSAAGFIGLRLGPRILRTETAGLAAMAILQARFGDLG